MQKLSQEALLEAGVHFGHLKRKWNPKMLPYIFTEKKGIHIIDLNRTQEKLEEAASALRFMAKSGKKILFVATKKQAKEIVKEAAKRVNMPFVTERWLGGMLTNFSTIRKSIKKMQTIERMLADGTLESTTKKEKLVLTREKDKMEKVLGGISALNRVPNAIFLVDISHEDIALKEAQRLNINTFGIVDTNSDPTKVDFAIPANDDAAQSIAIITNFIVDAIAEGLAERALNKDEENDVEVDDEKNHFDEIKEEESGEDGKGRRRRSGGSGHGGGAGTGGAGKSRSRSGGGAGPRK
ncbi:MAG: 30S ribosomal protein S2 [Chitinophagales bacterium]|nr:30S ribosomal protein S2 [Chitinophagales bacterium]MCO5281735.1 30S ribosomal protein S2 [Chitinophagales bacterium]OJV31413.1 MAG: 30S ribosomal protein S2 [Bacteroidetes bacterium 37-13]HRP38759.1 30S ribosomal protein S2 [Chitinophagales bacterium]